MCEARSGWYQHLLGCQSGHGGTEYERLELNGRLIHQLHRWDVEHQHGRLGDPDDKPYGNGVLLWFKVDDFDAVVARAHEMKAENIKPRHRSLNAHWECWLRDLEGYAIVLASPHGSAG